MADVPPPGPARERRIPTAVIVLLLLGSIVTLVGVACLAADPRDPWDALGYYVIGLGMAGVGAVLLLIGVVGVLVHVCGDPVVHALPVVPAPPPELPRARARARRRAR